MPAKTGLALWLALLPLSGCTLMEATADKALISRHSGEIRAVATRADRRITFVDENWMWGEDRERENVAYRMVMTSGATPADEYLFERYRAQHYCSEPSPDVTADVLERMATRLGHGVTAVELESDARSGIASLFRRSQGVQLFRDGLFALCQAHHNGAVGSEDYGVFMHSLMERTSYLIALELALTTDTVAGAVQGERAEVVGTALERLAPGAKPAPQGQSPWMAATDADEEPLPE